MSRLKRQFSTEFKVQVVQEVLSGTSQASVARRHSVSANTILQWLKAYRAGRVGGEATIGTDVQPLLAENRHLKELLGQRDLEMDFLKKAAAFAQQTRNGSSLIVSSPGPSPGKKSVS